jgi:signal transduction histidine kinase
MCEQNQHLLGGRSEIDTVRALFHDLREPLAAIMLLSASPKGDVDGKLHAINEQAQWLSELVDSSLDEAADDALQWVDARAIAEAVAARARSTTSASIAVTADVTNWTRARPVALARALACLVDNAVRAAGPSGHVQIALTDCGSSVHVTVHDDGPGLGRVAHRTSLGLTTVRAMVAACNGIFHLSSGEGGGAVAEIELPSGGLHVAVS